MLEYCRRNPCDRILFSTTVFDISLYAKPGVVLKPDLPYNFSYQGDHAVYVISKNTAIELMEHYYQQYGLKKSSSASRRFTAIAHIIITIRMVSKHFARFTG